MGSSRTLGVVEPQRCGGLSDQQAVPGRGSVIEPAPTAWSDHCAARSSQSCNDDRSAGTSCLLGPAIDWLLGPRTLTSCVSAAWSRRHTSSLAPASERRRDARTSARKAVRDDIVARRGKNVRNIAKVAAARKMLEVVYYVLRDGQARCLTSKAAA